MMLLCSAGCVFIFVFPHFLNLTFLRGVLYGCWDAERQWTHLLQYTLFSWFCWLIWFSKHAQRKEEPGMRLHRLGRCVTRNAGGIMSGTVDDMVQSVASLKSTRERITSLCCEKIVFLLSETNCWIGICASCIQLQFELTTSSPVHCGKFTLICILGHLDITLIFRVPLSSFPCSCGFLFTLVL